MKVNRLTACFTLDLENSRRGVGVIGITNSNSVKLVSIEGFLLMLA